MALTNLVYNYINELSSVMGTDGIVVYVSSGTVLDDGGGGNYRWSDSSVNIADGVNIIQVTGISTGRWARLPNNSYKTGTFSFSTVVGLGTYTVAHGLAYTPTYIGLTGSNQTGINLKAGVTTITATNFIVVADTLPLAVGTANFRYIATR